MILLIMNIYRVFLGFLSPISVYMTLEMTILVIWAFRIPVRLVQRLVRG